MWFLGRTAQPRVTQEGGARINVKVHVAGYERIACRTAVSVESRLLCVTPWTTAWLECAVNAFFGAVCVGVFVAFSACAPWMIEYRTYRCSFGKL